MELKMKPVYSKSGENSPKKKGRYFYYTTRNNFFARSWLGFCTGIVRIIEAIKGHRKIEVTWEEDKDGNKSRRIVLKD
jgi:hypothetical protein